MKEHKLKAIDHLLVTYENSERVSCFLNKSFQVLSVSSSNKKLDFKTTSNGDGQRLEITIPSDLRQSESIILDIAYEGCLLKSPFRKRRRTLAKLPVLLARKGFI